MGLHFFYNSVSKKHNIIHVAVFGVCLDVNECSAPEAFCDINAKCKNTRGSYRCLCIPGFTGDGKTCSGMMEVYIL